MGGKKSGNDGSEKGKSEAAEVATAVGAVAEEVAAGAALLAWGCRAFSSGSFDERKTMKAPRRNHKMGGEKSGTDGSEKGKSKAAEVATAVGAVAEEVAAGATLLAWGCRAFSSGSSDERKTMKAPGRNHKMGGKKSGTDESERGKSKAAECNKMGGQKSGTDGSEKGQSEAAEVATAVDAVAAAVAVGAAFLAWGFDAFSSGSSDERNTMKAPGRNHRINRDDFERDPASYFRDLRK